MPASTPDPQQAAAKTSRQQPKAGKRPRQHGHDQLPLAERHARSRQLEEERRQLPTWSAKDALIQQIRDHATVVVVGETGSGKTTQIPQYLLRAGLARGSMIACTQPRRVAAVTVARRVAEEMGAVLGQEVGYSVRFDDATSPATRIKYCTDGMLLREALLDPLLSKYKVVVVDEAHERTVHTDVLLGLLKGIQARRSTHAQQQQQQQQQDTGAEQQPAKRQKQEQGQQHHLSQPAQQQQQQQGPGAKQSTGKQQQQQVLEPLKLVIMSATLDAQQFSRYFDGAPALLVRGRTFPVEVLYTTQPEDNYHDAALNATLQVHVEEAPGDILVFLTGQEEIDALGQLLEEKARQLPDGAAGGQELQVLRIYAALPPEQQMKVFEPAPSGVRKAILATNIAETSITIPGVRYVIDTGFVKARGYHAKLGADSLQVVPVSQAQARQRSGRAGREAPGKAYRLFTEEAFAALTPTTPPEIQRSNLGSVVLQLKALGVSDLVNFDFMDPPPKAAIIRSLELLYALGALDSSGHLTQPLGQQMARLPVDPMYAKVLLAAAGAAGVATGGCAVEAMQVVAMVSAENIFYTPQHKREEVTSVRAKFVHPEGDHFTLLAVLKAFLEVPAKQQATWCSDNFVQIRSIRKALDIYHQLEGILTALGLPLASCGKDPVPLQRALVSGLFPHAARRQEDGTYKVLATGQAVSLHPSSVLCGKRPECVVFNELVRTTKQYAREVCRIQARWLPELAPAFFAARAGAGVEKQA